MVEELRQERGASALEYVGMLLVGTIFEVAVVSVINKDTVANWVKKAIQIVDGINP